MHLWWIIICCALASAKNNKKSVNYPSEEPPQEPDSPYGFIPDIEIYIPSVNPEEPFYPPSQPPPPSIRPSPLPIQPPTSRPSLPRPVQPNQVYVPVENGFPGDVRPSTGIAPIIPGFSPSPGYDPNSHATQTSFPPKFPPIIDNGDTSPVLPPPSPVSPLLPIPPSLGPGPGGFISDIYEVMPAGEMAQLTNIDVKCAMNSMRIRISFDRIFDGVIYSKGFFGDSNCHFVPWGSRQNEYEFEVNLDRCGTQFVDNMASGGSASLENILLLQNEPSIQEMWDVARRIQCLWQGKMDQSVSTGFQVDMLDTISVAYSGDDLSAEMSVLIGRGPFGQPAQGLLRIGESLSIVVSVFGAGDMDVNIHDCFAHDGDRSNGLQLTDANGCIVKKKLMGAWQFTRETGNTGASLIGYANLKAFRFPDKTDVYLECGLEICKGQCPNFCPEYPSIDFRSLPRAKRSIDEDPRDATLVRVFKVIDESVENNGSVALTNKTYRRNNDICISVLWLSVGLTCVGILLSCLSLSVVYYYIRARKPNDEIFTCKHKQRNI